ISREEPIIFPDGSQGFVSTTKVPLRNQDGSVVGIVGIGRDITARKQVEETLWAERNLLRTLIDNLPDSIYAKDTESRFVLGNAAVARVMGAATPDELTGKTDYDFFPGGLATQYYNDEQDVIRSGQALISREEPIIFPDGSQGFVSTTKVPLRNQDGSVVGIVGIGRDISGRKQVETKLIHMSTHDTMTGLYNRTYYDEEIARLEWSRQFPISILMADVDNLKEVNDKSGHNVGDELLRQVTQVLKASFRAEDMIARIGGDEFAIVLPGVNAKESKKAIRRIKDSIQKHNAAPDCLPINLSLGASTAETGNLLAEALKKADNAMYREKVSKE
ncbi:MAG: diguanylate cyclase, partial [Anaerolineales bacterium]|nr:diguanylate cyclase [Anaerolineales bacterium]